MRNHFVGRDSTLAIDIRTKRHSRTGIIDNGQQYTPEEFADDSSCIFRFPHRWRRTKTWSRHQS